VVFLPQKGENHVEASDQVVAIFYTMVSWR